jgi:hypothetical protein
MEGALSVIANAATNPHGSRPNQLYDLRGMVSRLLRAEKALPLFGRLLPPM